MKTHPDKVADPEERSARQDACAHLLVSWQIVRNHYANGGHVSELEGFFRVFVMKIRKDVNADWETARVWFGDERAQLPVGTVHDSEVIEQLIYV